MELDNTRNMDSLINRDSVFACRDIFEEHQAIRFSRRKSRQSKLFMLLFLTIIFRGFLKLEESI